MADNGTDKPTAAKASTKAADYDDTIETMQKQIGQMRREISSLKRSLAEQAEEAVDDAEGWLDAASEGASRATRAVRAQAQTVSGVVQDYPALFIGGIIGILVGTAALQRWVSLSLTTGRRSGRWR